MAQFVSFADVTSASLVHWSRMEKDTGDSGFFQLFCMLLRAVARSSLFARIPSSDQMILCSVLGKLGGCSIAGSFDNPINGRINWHERAASSGRRCGGRLLAMT